MKNFVKMVLAVICGLLIASILSVILSLSFVAALGAAGQSAPVMPKNGVLMLDMSTTNIVEQCQESLDINSIKSLADGSAISQVGLWDAVSAINAAAQDPAIRFLYLKTDGMSSEISTVEELRKSLAKFRASGKPVISYIESPSTGSYYLSSVADKIYMTSHDGATTMLSGVSGQLVFVKDLLDKFDVNVQLIRHGKYKSAGEMYIASEPSQANLEQNKAMISSIWASMGKEIAASRDISVEELDAIINDLSLVSPEDFLDNRLVDGLLTKEELKAKIADLAYEETFKKVHIIQFDDYVAAQTAVKPAKQKIAVIYADGNINDGYSMEEVCGDRFAEMIAKVRADSTVKAVVFRVNSPGGSVLGSEKIKAEIDLLSEVKPVVASYGSYAASGGYWISAACDHIFADETTLTGSIGVFSMIPDISGTLKNKAHVNLVNVSSHDHGSMLSLAHTLNGDETAYLQKQVENIYDRFVAIVSEGRNLEPDYVDSIAQGRVWTGADGLKIGLVDEIGTLEDAIELAALTASEDASGAALEKWNIVGYPKSQTMAESLMAMFNEQEETFVELDGTPFESLGRAAAGWNKMWKEGKYDVMFARMPFDMAIR